MEYDGLAGEYARHRRVHPGVLEGLVRDGEVSARSRVLEVGCGTGNYIEGLASLTGCSAWGIDPSRDMLKEARGRGLTAQLLEMSAESLDFPPGSFDLVFSVDVIHHVIDIPSYFQGARGVLSSGGRLCTATDSEWIIRNRRPLASHFPETVEVELARYPRIQKLKDLMAAAGLGGIRETAVERRYDVTDIAPYRDRAFSSLHLIPDDAFDRGLERLSRDLESGPVPCISRYVMLWGTREA